jgi:hypothetical protein
VSFAQTLVSEVYQMVATRGFSWALCKQYIRDCESQFVLASIPRQNKVLRINVQTKDTVVYELKGFLYPICGGMPFSKDPYVSIVYVRLHPMVIFVFGGEDETC